MTDLTPVDPQRKHHRQAGTEACRQKEPSARKSLQPKRVFSADVQNRRAIKSPAIARLLY